VLIHATLTITGDSSQLAACGARLRDLLSSWAPTDELSERHRPDALCYDLKVEGGIPFPAFAEASQAFPELSFEVEWVNVEAGGRGGVTLVNGRPMQRDLPKT
jgi:hypothetical protein